MLRDNMEDGFSPGSMLHLFSSVLRNIRGRRASRVRLGVLEAAFYMEGGLSGHVCFVGWGRMRK